MSHRFGLACCALAAALYGCDFTEPEAVSLPFSTVSAGREYTCGIVPSGTLYCWDDFPGIPVAISSTLKFTSVSARGAHGCGIAEDGMTYCWGDNTVGQLGRKGAVQFQIPGAVQTPVTFRVVSVGLGHTCGLAVDSTAYCWGANTLGQLGVDSLPGPCDIGVGAPDSTFPCSVTPLAVRPDVKFMTLTTGDFHTCAVAADSTAMCWGQGTSGQLGDGLSASSTPVPVAGSLKFLSVSPGGSHTCGITTSHDAYCWGSNSDLQLGSLSDDGSCSVFILRCATVPFLVTGGIKFQSVTTSEGVFAAGSGLLLGGHSCALDTVGHAYCWGLNEEGQLGGSTQLRSFQPVRARGDSVFTQISAGRTHTCGLTVRGDVRCWDHGAPKGAP